jgi:general L-amino acid transport system permease protein
MTIDRLDRRRARRADSWINDPRWRGLLYQVLLIVVVGGVLWWLGANAARNIATTGRGAGFDFLGRTSGFAISFSLIAVDRASTYLEMYIAGILNTLLVAVIGIVLATVLGFGIGIARLSNNWLLRKIAMVYVELVRNIPLLLQLFFWYFAVLGTMPAVRESILFPGGVVLNQRGLYLPRPIFDDRFWIVAIAALVGIVAALVMRHRARRKLEATGKRQPILGVAVATFLVILAVAWFVSGTQLTISLPELSGFNYTGGMAVPPTLASLVLGLVIYTSAFIGENVRAGIQAVSHGQVEAASSLGLRDGDRLRLVIIPQAMRVIVPPLTSQYLNLTKNSSLGAAIGFPELVSVFPGTTLNQTGRAIEVIVLTMAVYLTLSLITSAFMNWYNARVALTER